MENTERLPHERVWEFSTKPFALKAQQEFDCQFCSDADGNPGEMVVSHGQVFSFELGLHGDAVKRSHACDTWMYCWDCKWTVVHGVAIPQDVFESFEKVVLNAPMINAEGETVERKEDETREIPPGMSMTIMPLDEEEGAKRRPPEERWRPVYTEAGMEPLFPMTCTQCGRPGMFLRHSKMHMVKRDVEMKRWKIPFSRGKELRLFGPLGKKALVPAFRISYKCAECDYLATFVVPDTQEHFDTVMELRGGQLLYYPPLDEWGRQLEGEEDKLIRDKLETLGYV